MLDLFKKKQDASSAKEGSKEEKWYIDAYNRTIVIRNILFLLLSLSLICIICCSVIIYVYINNKKFEPYIIALDNTTGQTIMLSEVTSDSITNNESLARYFVKKYVNARESYSAATQWSNSRIVMILSKPNVYRQYRNYISKNNPQNLYGSENNVNITINSWSKLDASTYVLRVTLSEVHGQMKKFNKIVVISYAYKSMDLTDADFDINPVGFQVTSYSINDDNNS